MRHLIAFATLLLLTSVVYATSIVVLITPEYVLLGTDSRRTFLDAQSRVTSRQTVCKIRKSGKYCFALAGFVASGATAFSADSIVNTYLKSDLDYNRAIDSITLHIQKGLQQEFRYQRQHQPKALRHTLASRKALLEVVIVSIKDNAPLVQILGFELANTKTIRVKSYTASCPGDCPAQQAQFYLLGEYKGIERYLSNGRGVNDPVALVEKLITAQAQTTPSSVSAPINMVRFTASGMEWIK